MKKKIWKDKIHIYSSLDNHLIYKYVRVYTVYLSSTSSDFFILRDGIEKFYYSKCSEIIRLAKMDEVVNLVYSL